MLHILTRPPTLFFPGCFTYYAKATARWILRKNYGPSGVLQSLKRGLSTIHYSYSLNTTPEPGSTVHVLSNIEALRYAIKLKQQGHIQKLIAGPNLVKIPNEYNSILESPEIDVILLPSEWTKVFYAKHLPTAEQKMHIWPAGVAIPPAISSEKEDHCIVFKKDVPEDIYQQVIFTLKQQQISYTILEYGSFSQSEYFALLERSSYMIYLQKVESQGIALQEAWARNVPTLVWNPGSFTYPNGEIVTGNISAPFLTEQAGLFFKDASEFSQILTQFKEHLPDFTPRQYCIANLSDEASARRYANILEHITK